MERTCAASEAQSEIQKEHVAYLKEKDKKKKDKAEKWHGLSCCLVLNAASTNGQVPARQIPEYFSSSSTARQQPWQTRSYTARWWPWATGK